MRILCWLTVALVVGSLLFAGGAGAVNGQVSLGRPRPATEVVLPWVSFWCPQKCLGLAEWDQLVPDPKLRSALTLAYQYFPEWRPVARRLVQQRTRMVVTRPPSFAIGFYNPYLNEIEIHPNVLARSEVELAPLVVHETIHAKQLWALTAPAYLVMCQDLEREASTWEVAAWLRLPGRPATPAARQLDDFASKLREGKAAAILGDRKYRYCL